MLEKGAAERFNMKLAHIGINADSGEEALAWAGQFGKLLGLEVKDTPKSVYTGEIIEIKKNGGRGANGHIGLSVNNCEAALAYFAEQGVGVLEKTKKFRPDGKCYFAYLDLEIGGFAIHLVEE